MFGSKIKEEPLDTYDDPDEDECNSDDYEYGGDGYGDPYDEDDTYICMFNTHMLTAN